MGIRGNGSARFLIAGRLFHFGVARPRARLRADLRVRRRQGRWHVLPRRALAHQLSVEYRVRQPRPGSVPDCRASPFTKSRVGS